MFLMGLDFHLSQNRQPDGFLRFEVDPQTSRGPKRKGPLQELRLRRLQQMSAARNQVKFVARI